MTDDKKISRDDGAFQSSAIVFTGVLFLLATVSPEGSGFHIDSDPWIGVTIIAIGAALRAVALWRSSFEDE